MLQLKNIDKLLGHSTVGWRCVEAYEYNRNNYVISFENISYPKAHCVFYLGKIPIIDGTYKVKVELVMGRTTFGSDLIYLPKEAMKSYSEFLFNLQNTLARFEKDVEVHQFKSRFSRMTTTTSSNIPTGFIPAPQWYVPSPNVVAKVTKQINGGGTKSLLDRIKDIWQSL